MTNVLVIGIVGALIILIIAAYLQSKKTRRDLIAEMKEEILSNEPSPVAKPAPVVAKVKPTPVEVVAPEPVKVEAPAPVEEVKPAVVALQEVPALVEALAVKAAVQEMVATQEAPAPKPKNNRRRARPGKKQENNSTK